VGLRRRLRRLEEDYGFEAVVLITDDGEEFTYRGDPVVLVVEQWSATAEDRSVEHPLAARLERGLRLKHPGQVLDPLWRMLDGGRGGVTPNG
jgi:hypothetical protein